MKASEIRQLRILALARGLNVGQVTSILARHESRTLTPALLVEIGAEVKAARGQQGGSDRALINR